MDGTTVLGKLDLKWQSIGGNNNHNTGLEVQLVTLGVVTVITLSKLVMKLETPVIAVRCAV